jgi:methionyl-tRNA formyltransferase
MGATRYLVASGAVWGDVAYGRLNDGAWTLVQTPVQLAATDFSPYRYAFFFNWSYLVPTTVLAAIECVNFHCTALPHGRGGHPIENLILRGHTHTVITAHQMVPELDAGPIYRQSRRPISLAGTKDDICARFIAPVVTLARQILRDEPTPVPQAGPVTRFRRLSQEELDTLWLTRSLAP